MDAIIYARVSSDPHGRGRSVTEQETECRALCDREGWNVLEVFVDNDRSASRFASKARPAFTALKSYIESKPVDILVTWEASRLQRDLGVYVELREMCHRRGVLWSYSGRTYDLSRSDDRRSTGFDAVLAEDESGRTRDRVLRAVRSNAEAGRPHGRIPYGYRREYNAVDGSLVGQVIDQAQADLLHEVARRFLAGESFWALARELNDRGLPGPTGGVWHPTNLARLMKAPTYHGQRVHQGRIVGAANWPALFDDATWYSLQARLSDPERLTRRNEGLIQHLLTGIAQCGADGCGLRVKLGKNRGRLSYHCPEFHVSRTETEVDEVVVGIVVRRLSQEDAVDLLSARPGQDDAVREAVDEARTKRARLETFYDAAAQGDLTPTALARIEKTLLAEIDAAEKSARRSAASTVLGNVARIDHQRWDSLPMGTRREVLRLLVRITIKPVGKGRRVFDPDSVGIEWRTA
jgi:site-specific DNA recombinase